MHSPFDGLRADQDLHQLNKMAATPLQVKIQNLVKQIHEMYMVFYFC